MDCVNKEMVLEQNVTLGNDTVVMVWISSQDAAAVAQKGFRFIQGPSDYFYLVRAYVCCLSNHQKIERSSC